MKKYSLVGALLILILSLTYNYFHFYNNNKEKFSNKETYTNTPKQSCKKN